METLKVDENLSADVTVLLQDDYSGLIVPRLDRHNKPHVFEVLARIIPKLGDEPLDGKLWIVNKHTIRIRG